MRYTFILFVAILLSSTVVFSKKEHRNTSPFSRAILPDVISPDTSAPDTWGYTWVRSTEPGGPVYNWLDSTDGWQRVNGLLDDNAVGFFNLGFTFHYYWYDVTRLQIGSNGWIGFEQTIGNLAAAFTQFPNSTPPNDVIAPLGADYDFSPNVIGPYNSRVYFWTNNVDSAVISWVDAIEWFQTPPNPRPTYSFQVILTKADSSLTFQYGQHTGNGAFASESNITMGIENVTGTIGLSYYFASGSIDPTRYETGTAIRIKKTIDTGLQIVDAGVIGGFNNLNGAVFLQANVNNTISAYVKNFGTANLTNVRVRHTISRGVTTLLRDTVFIDTLSPGTTKVITFPKPFLPTQVAVHSGQFRIEAAGDVLASNNVKTTEMDVINAIPGTPIVLAYDDNVLDGTGRSWGSSGGFGNEFEVPVPVKIESAYVRIQTVTSGQTLTIYVVDDDGSQGSPGTVLDSVIIASPISGINKAYFGSKNIVVESGKFYIGETGQHTYAMDQTQPLSNRGWEITSGWGVNRFGATEDVMVRAVVSVVSSDVRNYMQYLPKGYEVEQNYPNPFNPSTTIRVTLAKKSNIKVVVYDILGNEIKTLFNGNAQVGETKIIWDGTNRYGTSVHSGVFFYRVQGDNFSETKKMLLLK
ncbi:MAG: T9SS type A sorting domain-containing protein [Ignavibacteria bacterium]|nr:T9SS type A sorting domain-containing protein [Ignavibacteria bacterium]